MSKDIETMKPVIAGAVGNPARTCAGSCEGNAYQIEIRRLTAERDAMAAELAALAKRKPAAVIATAGSTGGCVEWTGSIRLAVGSKLYIRPIPAEPVNARMLDALKRIEKWFGEFPSTGNFWKNGNEMSYGACYGSNGERDYMRSVARKAISESYQAASAWLSDDQATEGRIKS